MVSPFKNIEVPSANGKIDLNSDTLTLGTVITQLLPYVFGVAGIILLFMIISSGFQMMTSKGDPKIFQVAQGKLTTAVVGILILFASFFVVRLILKFFGIGITIIG
jgi:hypothetical protein